MKHGMLKHVLIRQHSASVGVFLGEYPGMNMRPSQQSLDMLFWDIVSISIIFLK